MWLAPLAPERLDLEHLLPILSPEERARAARFYFRRDQERFIAARGLLRRLLARYLHEPPRLISFRRNPYGKPALTSNTGVSDVRFSVSRSHGLALCAVALGREVGVDLERVRPDCAAEEIAARFFPAEERAALLSLPEPARTAAFLRCWTVKEACLKAKGLGLWGGLEGPVVALEAAEDTARCTASQPGEENGWEVKTFEPAPGYTAALAAAGAGWHMKTWRYEPARTG